MTIKKNLIAAFLVAIATIVFFALVLPTYDAIKNARTALQVREDKYKERNSLIEKVSALNNESQNKTSDIAILTDLIPTTVQQDRIVSSLSSIANQSGVALAELSVSEPQNQGNNLYNTGIITTRLLGRYTQLVEFLNLLEQNLRLYDVSELSISETTGAIGQAGLLNFQLKIAINVLNSK